MASIRCWLVALLAFAPVASAADTYLLMAEQAGCVWCARWDSEISHIYPKTAEGKAAPLRRYDIRRDAAPTVNLERRVHFTPTFILVRDGTEIGRIEGYPGEDFFWGLLGRMLEQADVTIGQTG